MKNIFLDSLLFCFTLILVNASSPWNNTSIRYLIPSTNGLLFQKVEKDHGETGVLYDCSLGLHSEGVVNIYDKSHPESMEFLTIENCDDLSLCIPENVEEYYNSDSDYAFPFLKEISLKNTRKVLFSCNSRSVSNSRYYQHFRTISQSPKFILSLQNVKIENLEAGAIAPQVIKLNLENVDIKTVHENGIDMKNRDESVLTIKNSRIENIYQDGIAFNGIQVEISNNSFSWLADSAFKISAKTSFLFRENHVPKIGRSLNVSSPIIEMSGNTFVALNKDWLKGISLGITSELGILNITKNAMNLFSLDLLEFNTDIGPDEINFSQNMFNCTCLWNYKYITCNKLSQIFLSRNKNVCQNLGNCSLNKVLKNMENLCEEEFTCSESQTPTTKSYLEMILSELKNIGSKLNFLINTKSYQTEKTNITENNIPFP